ncbi:hypothetical protein DICVIV_03407 [Dictyocaulus viviparus]|uniref:Uncharacterized protein n=1 Tax=Dictyocaulus viviparus TaxID=29172 RepID=A0A0D8Y1B4_DICVI|nr:hypothetical protein DICVIV_03407 [Dictyocaulus viviparus]
MIVIGNDTACEQLLRRLVGFEQEIVDAIVAISKSSDVSMTYMRKPICKVLREHFALIGVTTATERLQEFHELIIHNIRFEYVSNFVSLLGMLIRFSHLSRSDKFRKEVNIRLPVIIRMLWDNKRIAEACNTARVLMEHLLAARVYHADNDSCDIWLKQTLSEVGIFMFFICATFLFGYEKSSIHSCIVTFVGPAQY